MTDDQLRAETGKRPVASEDPAQSSEGHARQGQRAQPPKSVAPQAPAALGGMGSTGPITVVPRKR